ncbi:pyridoxamine 5'-phosphate oxidase family protein [Aedoeadaptatus coxii]|uniref:pyridoxamine 5'-phosphate oxidase family protein n=1 Tax=Aedoeadaptatus coxii TaxID=755172 RepID=UPI002AD3CE54|nr:pyridoxamine 5'-phosphate oxidase family protein [Peptoniphilus coxii]
MFREITRKNQVLEKDMVEKILETETWGVLSLIGDGDYPYGVPVNYAYCDGKIYFHGAMKGHKFDAMVKHDKVSFTVVSEDSIVEKEYTTAYSSVILFGRVALLEGEERKEALIKMTDRLAPHVDHKINVDTVDKCRSAAVFAITIEYMQGKVGRLNLKK